MQAVAKVPTNLQQKLVIVFHSKHWLQLVYFRNIHNIRVLSDASNDISGIPCKPPPLCLFWHLNIGGCFCKVSAKSSQNDVFFRARLRRARKILPFWTTNVLISP